ncbi:MAG: nucleotidyltransferase family protein, partial [Clostridiales bacterium]|nr:nucleotidyltransferase family protein [Clostridiales bacterium]
CAVTDKYVRARTALENGADIIIELPVIFSCASAENFARAAVTLLDFAGCEFISFGTDEPKEVVFSAAQSVADEPPAFKRELIKNIKQGLSFAESRSNAFFAATGVCLPKSPNAVLGVEYLKALRKINSNMKPLLIPRIGAAHDSTCHYGEFASASEIRRAALRGDWDFVQSFAPLSTVIALKQTRLITLNDFSLLLSRELLRGETYLSGISGISGGLEYRFIKADKTYCSFSEILRTAKTKYYSEGRIRRAAMNTVLGITKEFVAKYPYPNYIRIIGFRKNRQSVLKQIINNAPVPVITGARHSFAENSPQYELFKFGVFASELYYVVSGSPKSEFSFHPPFGV